MVLIILVHLTSSHQVTRMLTKNLKAINDANTSIEFSLKTVRHGFEYFLTSRPHSIGFQIKLMCIILFSEVLWNNSLTYSKMIGYIYPDHRHSAEASSRQSKTAERGAKQSTYSELKLMTENWILPLDKNRMGGYDGRPVKNVITSGTLLLSDSRKSFVQTLSRTTLTSHTLSSVYPTSSADRSICIATEKELLPLTSTAVVCIFPSCLLHSCLLLWCVFTCSSLLAFCRIALSTCAQLTCFCGKHGGQLASVASMGSLHDEKCWEHNQEKVNHCSSSWQSGQSRCSCTRLVPNLLLRAANGSLCCSMSAGKR